MRSIPRDVDSFEDVQRSVTRRHWGRWVEQGLDAGKGDAAGEGEKTGHDCCTLSHKMEIGFFFFYSLFLS